jgi:hypothetical protein
MRWLAILLVFGCTQKETDTSGEFTSETRPVLAPPDESDGFQMAMYGTAPAFSEVWLCSVYPLPVDAEGFTAVQSVEYNQNEGTHHFTLSALGFSLAGTATDSPIEHGTYDCNDLYGDSTLMEEAIMVFGGQGDAQGEMSFPEGTVANVPATIDVLHEVHYVNPTPDEVEIYSEINAYTVPQTSVDKSMWGGSVRDENIEIPANSVHTEWSRCVFNEDVEILLLAGHQHELGTRFDIAPYDGETGEVGEVFFSNDDWHTPDITQYEPPRVVPAGQGFEWTCEWNNTTSNVVQYGNEATDEMCNMAVVFQPVEGMISMSAACEVVETSDGVLWQDD